MAKVVFMRDGNLSRQACLPQQDRSRARKLVKEGGIVHSQWGVA